MKNNQKRGLALVLSVAVHGAILALLLLNPDFAIHAPVKHNEVELVDPEKLLQAMKQAQNKPIDQPNGQIVEQDEKAINDEIDKNARFLSRHNQKVIREEQAAVHGKFKNTDGTGGQKSVEREAGIVAKHADNAKEGDKDQPIEEKADKNTDKYLTSEDGVASGPHKKPTMRDLTPSFKPTINDNEAASVARGGGEGPSATDDHLKNVKTGMQTMLSTREFVYYSYYNRIKDKLRQYWEPKIKEKVERIVRQGRTIASADRVTRIVITLDKAGTLVRVQIVGASGVNDLDDAAVEAFRAAAPFPNPPKGIVDADGTIKIRWDFILEASTSNLMKAMQVAHFLRANDMRANNVIIISSGRSTYAAGGALDELIRTVRSLKKQPVLVLGPDGDDLLRTCEELENCEIVFDPNYDGQLFSGVKAGLHAIQGAAFVVALAEPVLEPARWAELEKALLASPDEHVLRPVTEANAPVYPQLVTPRGVPALKSLPAETDWTDSKSILAKPVSL